MSSVDSMSIARKSSRACLALRRSSSFSSLRRACRQGGKTDARRGSGAAALTAEAVHPAQPALLPCRPTCTYSLKVCLRSPSVFRAEYLRRPRFDVSDAIKVRCYVMRCGLQCVRARVRAVGGLRPCRHGASPRLRVCMGASARHACARGRTAGRSRCAAWPAPSSSRSCSPRRPAAP